MVHGRLRHSQSQGSVERANRKFRENIRAWFITNDNTACKDDCPTAALFAKWTINTSYHSIIRNKPYKLVFGQNPICGIMNLPLLSEEIAQSLRTEEDVAVHYSAEQNVQLEEVRPSVIDISQLIGNNDSATQSGRQGLGISERNTVGYCTLLDTDVNAERRRGTLPLEPNHTPSAIENERFYDSEPVVDPLIYPTMEAEYNNESSALVKFCDMCRHRIYAQGNGTFSTHLATGEDEAMCTCILLDSRDRTRNYMEEASDNGSGSRGDNIAPVVIQNTVTHASVQMVAGSQRVGELENVRVDNSMEDLRAKVEEQLADNGGPNAGELNP